MKNLYLLLIFLMTCFISCNDDNNNVIVRTMYVASERVYINEPAGGPALFYLVRYSETENWSHIKNIRDFQYENGNEYVIKTRITTYSYEPGTVIDSDQTLYECLEILDQEQKTSSGLPGNAVD